MHFRAMAFCKKRTTGDFPLRQFEKFAGLATNYYGTVKTGGHPIDDIGDSKGDLLSRVIRHQVGLFSLS